VSGVHEDLLRKIPLFRRLSLEDLRHLAAATQARSFPRGATVFSGGNASTSLFIVARGRVKVFKVTPAGKDIILEIFGPGDPLGAVAVYEERPYPASAVAVEDAVCLETPRAVFFELLERHPTLVRGLLAALNLRLVELTNRLTELTGGRVEPRFARLFLKLADEIGRPADAGVEIPLALSRQELADLAGTTIETAIRIMSRWGKEGVVLTEKDGFVVADRATLEVLASS
jgi:CRP-like cAMP-binding protein